MSKSLRVRLRLLLRSISVISSSHAALGGGGWGGGVGVLCQVLFGPSFRDFQWGGRQMWGLLYSTCPARWVCIEEVAATRRGPVYS